MANDRERSDARGAVLVFVAASALGTLGVISTIAYDAGVSAPVFSALRAALGAAILGGVVLARWQPRVGLSGLPGRQRRMLLVAIVANGSMNLVLFAGFEAMSVAVVMTLFYSYPVWVLLADAATGRERVTALRIAALALAMAGLVLVVGSQISPDAVVSAVGIGLALAAAGCQAGYLVVSRDGYTEVPAVQATSLILLGGMLISGTAALVTGSLGDVATWAAEPVVWLAVLLAGTIGAAMPKVLVLMGVRRLGGTRTALVMLAEPVVAVILASVVLGQSITPLEALGAAAILIAAALAQRPAAPGVPLAAGADTQVVGSHE